MTKEALIKEVKRLEKLNEDLEDIRDRQEEVQNEQKASKCLIRSTIQQRNGFLKKTT